MACVPGIRELGGQGRWSIMPLSGRITTGSDLCLPSFRLTFTVCSWNCGELSDELSCIRITSVNCSPAFPTAIRPIPMTSSDSSPAIPNWLTPLLLALAVCAVYANSLQGVMLFDDPLRLIANPSIRQLWPAEWLEYNQRPVAYFTFTLNYVLHGTALAGWHVVNIAIHLLAGLTLYGIVRRMLLQWLPEEASRPLRAEVLAGLSALLWLVHPLQTESVTYIVQRIEALMGLFVLLTLYGFIRSQENERKTGWLLFSIVCCLLGCATKEVGAMAPLVVLWYDRAFVAGSWGEILKRRWWYYAGLCCGWLLLGWLMASRWEMYSDAAGSVPGLTPLTYFVNQPPVILHYLRLSVWPTGQNLDRTWPLAEGSGQLVIPFLLVTLLFALTFTAIWKWRRWSFAGGWFFLILAPTSSFVPIADLSFEHRMYLPLAALAVLAVLAVEWLVRRISSHSSQRTVLKYVAAGVLTLAACLGTATVLRNRVYHSPEAMWQNVLQTAPDSARAHNLLSRELLRDGRYQAALRHAERAVELIPMNVGFTCDLARTAFAAGHPHRGILLAAELVQQKPDSAEARLTLGTLLLGISPEKAVEHLRAAVRLDPGLSEGWANLGRALVTDDVQQAAECYARALELNPSNAVAHNNMANLLARRGEYERALRHYGFALTARPDYTEALRNRKVVREMQAAAESL